MYKDTTICGLSEYIYCFLVTPVSRGCYYKCELCDRNRRGGCLTFEYHLIKWCMAGTYEGHGWLVITRLHHVLEKKNGSP